MPNLKRHAAALAAFFVTAIAIAAGGGEALGNVVPEQRTVPGELVVGFDSGATRQVTTDPDRAADVARRLARRPAVRYVEPNFVVRAARLPNDERIGRQWGLRDVHATAAWNITTGGPVTVAVVDTGVAYDHPDLASNMWTNTSEREDGTDQDGDGFPDDIHGTDFLGHDGDPGDDDGHGTHVAGIIGARGDNSIGVAGLNWNVRIMALKFLDSFGDGNTADAAAAIDYAVDHGARVINASWSGPQFSRALYSAIQRAGAKGVLVVAAAGNDGVDTDRRPEYPAAFDLPNVVSVAASDRGGRLLDFSNRGTTSIDLAAPGDDVDSTVPFSVDGSGYAAFSGTSMAAPFVTGAAALYLSRSPAATATQVRDAILGSVDRSPSLSGNTASGGRLDIAAMLRTPDSFRAQKDTTAPAPFALRRPGDRRVSRKRLLRFRWRPATDAGGIREYRVYVDGRRIRTVRDHDGPARRDPRPRTSIKLRGGRHRWFVRAVDYAGNMRRSHAFHRHRSVKSSVLFVRSD